MVSCELCGKTNVSTKKVKVAGTQMDVCGSCNNFGSNVEKDGPVSHTFYKKLKNDDENLVVCSNYSSKINSALAKRELTMHHLAKSLNIKESMINKIILGKLQPEIETAKRIENFLEIKLLEPSEPVKVEDYMASEKKDNSPSTLGDLLKEQLKK